MTALRDTWQQFVGGGWADASDGGRFGGTAAIHEFTDLRWITARSEPHPFPF